MLDPCIPWLLSSSHRLLRRLQTQPQAKWKAAKNAKAELIEDKKIAFVAHKAKSVSKKKELLNFFAEVKASTAGSKVNKVLTKLVEAASAVLISSQSHPHRKCKGISSSPSPVHSQAGHPQLSPHQTTAMANKRVSL
jgi:hypothetical protein